MILSQVQAVGQLAFTISTLGAGAAVGQVSNDVPGKIAQLRAAWKEISELPKVKEAIKNANDIAQAAKLARFLGGDLEPSSPEEAVRLAAQVASFFDTSGISSTIAAFTYGRCSSQAP